MARSKKTTEQTEADSNSKVEVEEVIEEIATEQPAQPEEASQQAQQNQEKPLFTSDNETEFRNLLLERPGVPTITNIEEAIEFMGRYEKWNSKVQLAFK
jgi:hypothetical protein